MLVMKDGVLQMHDGARLHDAGRASVIHVFAHVGIDGLDCADTMPARIAEMAMIAERIVYYFSAL